MASKSQSYNFTLQKYMLLQEQHEELCSHLDQIRPRLSSSGSSMSVSTMTSPATSPTRCSSSPSLCMSPRVRQHARRSPSSRSHRGARRGSEAAVLDTILDEDTVYEISAEEQRLLDVNESIKRALTELLNCDTVRSDLNVRMWVQARLMETEKELRSGRRRKGSTGSD